MRGWQLEKIYFTDIVSRKRDQTASLDKIFFFLAAGFPDKKFPANFFYKYEFWL
jgi:hypothetical protein